MTPETKLLALTAQGFDVIHSTQPLYPFVLEIAIHEHEHLVGGHWVGSGKRVATLRGLGKSLGEAADMLVEALDGWRKGEIETADTVPPLEKSA